MSRVIVQPSTKVSVVSSRVTQSKPVWLVIGVGLLLLISFLCPHGPDFRRQASVSLEFWYSL